MERRPRVAHRPRGGKRGQVELELFGLGLTLSSSTPSVSSSTTPLLSSLSCSSMASGGPPLVQSHAKLLRRAQSVGDGLNSEPFVVGQHPAGTSTYDPYSDDDEDSLAADQPQSYYSHRRGMSQISDHYVPVVVPQGPNRTHSSANNNASSSLASANNPPFQPSSFSNPYPPQPADLSRLRSSSSQPYMAPSHPALQQGAGGSHHLAFTPRGHTLAPGSPISHQPATPFTPAGPQRSQSAFSQQQQQPHQHQLRPSGLRTQSDGSADRARPRSLSLGGGLERQGTLLSHGVGPVRNGQELNRILGKGQDGRKVVGGANGKREEDVRLEAGRKKARVEIDVMLERDVMVEGGEVKGRMEIKVREWNKKEGDVYVSGGKVRVVGFEDLPSHNSRHIFYHHSHVLPLFLPNTAHRSSLFDTSVVPEDPSSVNPSADFRLALAGHHDVPFSLPLPITNFPRGPFRSSQGSIKYILIASLKLFFPTTGKKSIAHFYRHVTIYPFLDVDRVLRNFDAPLEVERQKKVGGGWTWGKVGKTEMTVKSARAVWVAGQQCWLDIGIRNDGVKKINQLDISLHQITTFYFPVPHLNMGSCLAGDADTDAVQTSSRRKKISESSLEAGQNGGRGFITGKGWWKGCEPKRSGSWGLGILIPPDALSIPRGRLLEVNYFVRVVANGTLHAELPIRIINFLSIDPPPCPTRIMPTRQPAPMAMPISRPIHNSHPAESVSSHYDDVTSVHTSTRHAPEAEIPAEDRLKQVRSMGPVQASLQASSQSGKRSLQNVVAAVRGTESVDSEDSKGLLTHRASMAFLKTTIDEAAQDDEDDIDLPSDGEDEGGSFPGFSRHDDDEDVEDLYGDDRRSIGEASSGQAPFAYDDQFAIDVEGEPTDKVRSDREELDGAYDSSAVGSAMQSLMIESDEDASDADDDEILKAPARWSFAPSSHPIVKSRTRSSLDSGSQMDRSPSGSSAWSPRASVKSPTQPRPSSLASSVLSVPRSHRSQLSVDRLSPSLDQRESIAEDVEPPTERRVSSASLARRCSTSLSIHPELVHPVARSPRLSTSPLSSTLSPRMASATPLIARTVVPAETIEEEEVVTPPASVAEPTTPAARVVQKKKSFSFASPAAPVRVKVRPTQAGASPARIRPSTSATNLRATKSSSNLRATPPTSPVKVRDAAVSLLHSPKKAATARVALTSAEDPGRYTPRPFASSPGTKSAFAAPPQSPSRLRAQQIVDPRSMSPTRPGGVSPDLSHNPGLATSSDSGSSSDATPPMPSASRMSNIALLSASGGGASPPKTSFHAAKHLSQAFAHDPSAISPMSSPFDGGKVGATPTSLPPMPTARSYSVDFTALPSRSKTSASRAPASSTANVLPSVKNKILQLETRNTVLKEFTSPTTSPAAALRRSATTARLGGGGGQGMLVEELDHNDALRAAQQDPWRTRGDGWGHQRKDSVASVQSDVSSLAGGGGGGHSLLGSVNQKGLSRQPSAVSFRAPLLRKSVAAQGGQGPQGGEGQ